MFSFTGNTTGTVTSDPKKLPMVLESFSIVNKAAGSVTVNVYKITTGGGLYCIAPHNLSLSQSEMYEGTRAIVILATEQVKVHTNGSVDYDFTFNNSP